jgi:hypothetical protein
VETKAASTQTTIEAVSAFSNVSSSLRAMRPPADSEATTSMAIRVSGNVATPQENNRRCLIAIAGGKMLSAA